MSKPKYDLDQIKEAAHGRWQDLILPRFDIHVKRGKHTSCPAPYCGGTDRFHYKDKKGDGHYICNQCGAGDGFSLIQKVHSIDFPTMLREIAAILGIEAHSEITDQQRERWKRDRELREKARIDEEKRLQESVARSAVAKWRNMYTGESCPYLQRKKVPNYGCKIRNDGALIVPLYDAEGKMWNLQTITDDGKFFIKDGRVKGCFAFLGTQDLQDPIILIAEGYATAASIHMALGERYPVAVAFNAGNLLPVGEALRAKNPTARILYCGDFDPIDPKTGFRPGEHYAHKALAVTGDACVFPIFDTEVSA